MGTYSRQIFTGSSGGRGIPITATAATGTLIHTVPSGVLFDEIYLDMVNLATASKEMTVEFGTSTDPTRTVEVRIPGNFSGIFPAIVGYPLQSGQTLRAWGATGDVVAFGYVSRLVS